MNHIQKSASPNYSDFGDFVVMNPSTRGITYSRHTEKIKLSTLIRNLRRMHSWIVEKWGMTTDEANLLTSQYLRINTYNGTTWAIAGGTPDTAKVYELDRNFKDFNKISTVLLPDGETLDFPHFFAALNGSYRGFGSLCGYGGDIVDLATDRKSGNSSMPSPSCNREDIISDIDAYNISNISLLNGIELPDAIEDYYNLYASRRMTYFINTPSTSGTYSRITSASDYVLVSALLSSRSISTSLFQSCCTEFDNYVRTAAATEV